MGMLSPLVMFSAVVTGESYVVWLTQNCSLALSLSDFICLLFLSLVSFVVGRLLLFCFVLIFVSCMKAYSLRLIP